MKAIYFGEFFVIKVSCKKNLDAHVEEMHDVTTKEYYQTGLKSL